MARYITASSATDNGDGTWTYDYAVMNVNSDRAAGAIAFRMPAGAIVTSAASFAPMYHSGDRTRNVPWVTSEAAGRLGWRVDPTTEQRTYPAPLGTVTFNPNAIMFGAVHSYRFTVNRAPSTGWLHLGLFKAPADSFGFQGSSLAVTGAVVPIVCVADVGSQGGFNGPDGALDNNDFVAFIGQFFEHDLIAADIGRQGGLAGPDNSLDNNDFIAFIQAFFDGCS
ncbi:MAG: GC-type dockerin domain-anchored protein [Phycisphaerales bacterium]